MVFAEGESENIIPAAWFFIILDLVNLYLLVESIVKESMKKVNLDGLEKLKYLMQG